MIWLKFGWLNSNISRSLHQLGNVLALCCLGVSLTPAGRVEPWNVSFAITVHLVINPLAPRLLLGEHPNNCGSPYLFLQPLNVTTLYCNLGLGSRLIAYQKQLLGPKAAGSWLGEHTKNLGPLIYFCNRWSQRLQIWYATWVRVAKYNF